MTPTGPYAPPEPLTAQVGCAKVRGKHHSLIAGAERVAARILIVDDHLDGAWALAQLLEIEGYVALTAASGEGALREIHPFRPDVVILDLDMPRMSGFEVAREIQRESRDGIPLLIALSGWDSPEHRKDASEAGFAAFVVKPVIPQPFLSQLSDLLNAKEPPPSN